MKRSIVPDVVQDQDLVLLVPETTVREAAGMLAARHVGAVLVTDDGTATGRLDGIFTERDMVNRVVAQGLDPNHTPVATVMTREPACVRPEATALDALRLMRHGGYRHLPVVADGRLLGIVSMRDFLGAEFGELESEMAYMDAFVEGPHGK